MDPLLGSISPENSLADPGDLASPKVVVVADHPTTLAIVMAMVRKLGHEAEHVDARSALAVAGQHSKLTILVDLDLDDVDAIDLGRRIRGLDNGSEQQIFSLGTPRRGGDRSRCREAGFDAFLSKPIRGSELQGILDLRRLQAGDATESSKPLWTLDCERLDTLRDLEKQAGQVVVEPMVRSFLESANEALSLLHEAAETRDFSLLKSEAHGLVGRALNLGAVRVGAACRQLERQARDQVTEDLAGTIDLIEKELEIAAVEFRDYLERSA